jgi:hypothetical protein
MPPRILVVATNSLLTKKTMSGDGQTTVYMGATNIGYSCPVSYMPKQSGLINASFL